MRLKASEYDEAWLDLLDQILDSYHMLDLWLRYWPPLRTSHVGPTRYMTATEPLSRPMQSLRFQATSDVDVRAGDIEGFTAFMYELAQECVRVRATQSFARISEVVAAFDNLLDDKDKPLSWDFVLTAIEQTGGEIDSHRNIAIQLVEHPRVNPTECFVAAQSTMFLVVANPKKIAKLKESEWTAHHQQRFDEIVTKKRHEFYDEKRSRRLS